MKIINHTNILRYIDAFQTKQSIYIFFEYCNGGDLQSFLKLRGGRLSETLVRNIALQLISGLAHLNELDIIHRDLKLTNIMLHFPTYKKAGQVPEQFLLDFDYERDVFEIVIVDLGLARSISGDGECAKTFCGSLLHMAPEVIDGYQYGPKVDIWAFGTVIYQILTGFPPFFGKNKDKLIAAVKKGEYGIPKDINLSLDMVKLLNMCLQADPDERCGHVELVEYCVELLEENKKAFNELYQCKEEYPKNALAITKENSYILSIRDPKYFLKAKAEMVYNSEESLLQSLNLGDDPQDEEQKQGPHPIFRDAQENTEIGSIAKTAFSNSEVTTIVQNTNLEEYEILDVDDSVLNGKK